VQSETDATITLPKKARNPQTWASFAPGAGAAIGLATWHDSSTLELAENLSRG